MGPGHSGVPTELVRPADSQTSRVRTRTMPRAFLHQWLLRLPYMCTLSSNHSGLFQNPVHEPCGLCFPAKAAVMWTG